MLSILAGVKECLPQNLSHENRQNQAYYDLSYAQKIQLFSFKIISKNKVVVLKLPSFCLKKTLKEWNLTKQV